MGGAIIAVNSAKNAAMILSVLSGLSFTYLLLMEDNAQSILAASHRCPLTLVMFKKTYPGHCLRLPLSLSADPTRTGNSGINGAGSRELSNSQFRFETADQSAPTFTKSARSTVLRACLSRTKKAASLVGEGRLGKGCRGFNCQIENC
jgi:hypothetical protein